VIDDERGPSVPAVSEDRVGVLSAYVQTNRDRFTDEALREAAHSAGYTDAEIAAAWSAAADPKRSIPSERQTSVGVVVLTAIVYGVTLYLAAGALSTVGAGELAGIAAIGGLLAGIVGWVLLRDSRPSLALGLGWGVLLAVGLPLIIVLGILGICLVAGTIPFVSG
jgi:hypothetical protein